MDVLLKILLVFKVFCYIIIERKGNSASLVNANLKYMHWGSSKQGNAGFLCDIVN